MKKIFTIAALAASMLGFAQQSNDSTDYGNIVSANFTVSEPGQFGISYEREGSWNKLKKSSAIINLSAAATTYEVGPIEVDGTGYVIEYGYRTYYGKNAEQYKGFYSAGYLSYGSLEFDENTPLWEFSGTYSYFSFFSPEIGYKFKFGNFVVDPFIGAQWKIEIKGKGDIDNKNTDEWAFKGGVKLGYRF